MGTTEDEDFVVHLDRPRIVLVGAVILAVSLAIAWWASLLGLIGAPMAGIMLIRGLDPRPQLVLTAQGAMFGGLLKSTFGRDVHVTWAEIRKVTLVADQMRDPPRVTKSIPMAPERLTRAMKRLIPPNTLEVETGTRVLSVYPPGRRLTLEKVEREILHRWRAGSPSA